MRVRSIVAGLATTAVAVSTASLVALAPAHADPSFTPDANDIVGVGSDTSENVMDNLADGIPGTAGYNGGKTAADARLVSWDTEGTAQITPRAGATAINRPVGSGAGKALLFGASNNPDITFARSSSAENATEVAGGLQSFPFALDTLSMAVSGTVKSHAPASLTGAQIVSIFKGDVTNWNQVGGKAGTIKPFVPQAGSGTRSFFEAQLTNLNGGTPVVYGPGVDTNMHENTDTVLASDPNAVAPFSVGKANTLFPTSVHLEGGFNAQRALYNVVRGADVADATITGIFGSAGFICSAAATPLIEAAGFLQLATPAHGGVCGAATQNPTSNLTTNSVPTTTRLVVKSTRADHADLVARVTGSTAPSGTVSFFEGATLIKSGIPLISGQATLSPKASPGAHTYSAQFTPDLGSAWLASQDDATGTVKTSASVTESFPAKVAKGDRASGRVTVALKGISKKATGTVRVMEGKKVLAKGKLARGKVTLKLPKLSKGKHSLKAAWAGDSLGAAAVKAFTITQK